MDKKNLDVHDPEAWGSMSIDELARYFLQHPEDPHYATFINANDGSGEHNEILRRRLRSMQGKSSYLGDLDLDDIAQYVFEYFWENGFEDWNADDYPFISYLYNILKPNASLGYSIRKTERNPDAVSLDNELIPGEDITGLDVLAAEEPIDDDIIIENTIERVAEVSGIDRTDLEILFALDDPKEGYGTITNDFMVWANNSILIPAGKTPCNDLIVFRERIYNLRRTLKRKKELLMKEITGG